MNNLYDKKNELHRTIQKRIRLLDRALNSDDRTAVQLHIEIIESNKSELVNIYSAISMLESSINEKNDTDTDEDTTFYKTSITKKSSDFALKYCPPWASGIAMDKNGKWYVHVDTPHIEGDEWRSTNMIEIPDSDSPECCENWEDSWHPLEIE